jgi:hypothetical protein
LTQQGVFDDKVSSLRFRSAIHHDHWAVTGLSAFGGAMNPTEELPENAEVRSHILPGDMDFVIRQDDNSFEKSYQLWFIIKY